MRNPWARLEWQGDWCDNSPLWNDQLKKKVDFVKNSDNDGLFFMSIEDFI